MAQTRVRTPGNDINGDLEAQIYERHRTAMHGYAWCSRTEALLHPDQRAALARAQGIDSQLGYPWPACIEHLCNVVLGPTSTVEFVTRRGKNSGGILAQAFGPIQIMIGTSGRNQICDAGALVP